MASGSSRSSLTSYLWENMSNATINAQLFRKFGLNDEETAKQKFTQAIKNIKSRKKFKANTMKPLLNKVDADFKQFLGKTECKQYFISTALVESINQEEVSRETFKSAVREEEYRNKANSLKRQRSETIEEEDQEGQGQAETRAPDHYQREVTAQEQRLHPPRASTPGHLQAPDHFQGEAPSPAQDFPPSQASTASYYQAPEHSQGDAQAQTQAQYLHPSRASTPSQHTAYPQYRFREATPQRQYDLYQSREPTQDQHQAYPQYCFQDSTAQYQFEGSTRPTTPMSAQPNPAQGDDGPNEIQSKEDIWICWEKHLANDTLHQHSLERLGIIQCGANVNCKPNYPQELYDLLVFDNTKMSNPVADNHEIFDEIFDAGMNPKKMLQLLGAISYDQKRDKKIGLVHSILTTLLSLAVDTNDSTSNEASFSFYVVWPLIHAVAKAVDNTVFHPGEYYLEAISSEFARRRITSKQHYKADGCISVTLNRLKHELVLLEVSGHYKLEDEARFTKDHIKAGYGLLAMLNQIAYQYEYASFDVFTGIRVYFVHVKNTKLRLWSFEMASPGLYIMNLVNSQEIPDEFATSELALESLCIELWNLKEMLDTTMMNLRLLAQCDAENRRLFNRKRREMPGLEPTLLRDSLKINPQVKLDADYLKDHQDLDVYSSLY